MKNWLGRVLWDIENKCGDTVLSPHFQQLLTVADKLLVQERHTPKKIYSLHELEVCCIGKGKNDFFRDD